MPDEAEDGSAPVEVTTAATSFLFSNASTRTRSSFGRSASASQMVDRLFSAALHRGSAQRSPDGAVTTATDARRWWRVGADRGTFCLGEPEIDEECGALHNTWRGYVRLCCEVN